MLIKDHGRAVYRGSSDTDIKIGNKKVAGMCTIDHVQLVYNSHTLLRNLAATFLLPKFEPGATLSLSLL